jgi:hypothetical protein
MCTKISGLQVQLQARKLASNINYYFSGLIPGVSIIVYKEPQSRENRAVVIRTNSCRSLRTSNDANRTNSRCGWGYGTSNKSVPMSQNTATEGKKHIFLSSLVIQNAAVA